jgi:hypothetical protein
VTASGRMTGITSIANSVLMTFPFIGRDGKCGCVMQPQDGAHT